VSQTGEGRTQPSLTHRTKSSVSQPTSSPSLERTTTSSSAYSRRMKRSGAANDRSWIFRNESMTGLGAAP
jgi:hypothetical protein